MVAGFYGGDSRNALHAQSYAPIPNKRKNRPKAAISFVRDRGIELLTSAWKADVIPFN